MEKEAKITVFMRRVAVLVAVVAATLMSSAQVGTDEGPVETPQGPVIAPSYAWRMIQPLGLREPADIDTLFQNYSRESVPSEISSAWACTGNAVAEGLNMIFDERPAMSDFFFRDAVAYWLPSAAKAKFYNTRIPMTLLSFNTAGGRSITSIPKAAMPTSTPKTSTGVFPAVTSATGMSFRAFTTIITLWPPRTGELPIWDISAILPSCRAASPP